MFYNGPGISTANDCITNSLNTLLPVEYLTFTVKVPEEGNILDWITSTEINNEGFYIEKKFNGVEFETIGFMQGSENSSESREYEYFDTENIKNNPSSFNRLNQIDFDGTSSYSKTIAIKNKTKFEGNVTLRLINNVLKLNKAVSNISVYQIDGRLISHYQNQEEIDLGYLLSEIYIISTPNYSQKIIKSE